MCEMPSSHRWNFEETPDGIRLCRGDHHRSEDCEWEEYVPAATAAQYAPLVEAVREAAAKALKVLNGRTYFILRDAIGKALGAELDRIQSPQNPTNLTGIECSRIAHAAEDALKEASR